MKLCQQNVSEMEFFLLAHLSENEPAAYTPRFIIDELLCLQSIFLSINYGARRDFIAAICHGVARGLIVRHLPVRKQKGGSNSSSSSTNGTTSPNINLSIMPPFCICVCIPFCTG